MRTRVFLERVASFSRHLATIVFFIVLAIAAGPGADRDLYARISPDGQKGMAPGPVRVTLKAGKFLVARGAMRDPNFSGTVIYLLRYDLLGTLGVVVNRPTDIRLSDALPHIDWLKSSDSILMWGGPVERTKLIILALSKEPIEGAEHVQGNLYVGWDINKFRDFFQSSAGEIKAVRAYGGYAGWAPGQLAAEVERGGWRVVDAPAEEIFRDTTRLWYRLIGRH